MKIIVFGASGLTGLELLMQLLARGHEVTAVVHDGNGFHLKYERLTVVEADALQPDSFEAALKGQDTVVSVMGVTGFLNSLRPMTFYQDSARAIVDRMKAHSVQRLVVISSVGVLPEPSTPVWYRGIVKPLLRHKYDDMRNMEQTVTSSGLHWTIVRPGQLTNDPLTQKYRVSRSGTLPDVTKISRSDLADFLAEKAQGETMIGQKVAISY